MQTVWALAASVAPGWIAIFSAEFLPGPHLMNNLLNLGIVEPMRHALAEELEFDLDDLAAEEEEPGLGNGGLGRLASCYMDSLSSLDVPAIGYGIRYEFSTTRESSGTDGRRRGHRRAGSRNGNPLGDPPAGSSFAKVKFGGHTEKWLSDRDQGASASGGVPR